MDPADTLFVLLSQGTTIPDSVLEAHDQRHCAREVALA